MKLTVSRCSPHSGEYLYYDISVAGSAFLRFMQMILGRLRLNVPKAHHHHSLE